MDRGVDLQERVPLLLHPSFVEKQIENQPWTIDTIMRHVQSTLSMINVNDRSQVFRHLLRDDPMICEFYDQTKSRDGVVSPSRISRYIRDCLTAPRHPQLGIGLKIGEQRLEYFEVNK